MSKTSFILFLLLFIVLGVFLIIHYSPARAVLPAINSSLNKNAASPAAQTATALTLRAKPAYGETVQVEVVLNTVTTTPSIAQLELGYDPNALTLYQVLPGSYFNQPKVLLNSTIPRTGRMSYAVSCSDKKTCVNTNSDAVLAIITFTINPYAQKKATEVKILPKTLLRDGNDQEILLQTQGTNVFLPADAPLASPSAVLTQ